MNRQRPQMKRALVLESLEGKLLLSTSTFKMPMMVTPHVHHRGSGSTTTGTGLGTGTGTGVGVGTGTGTGTGTGVGIGTGTGTGTGTGNGMVNVRHDSYHERGNETDYNTTYEAGGYRFRQSFHQSISRIRRNDGNVVTATDAINQFQNELQNQRDLHRGSALFGGSYANNNGAGGTTGTGTTGTGTGTTGTGTGSGATATVEHLSYHERGNHITFDETLSAGGYRFRESYTMDLNRIRNNDGNVVTQTDAINQFFTDLNNHRDQVRGGSLSGGTNGTGTGTTMFV